MAELGQEDGEKKSLKKPIIIIVGIVLLLAVSSGATFFLMKDFVAKEEKVSGTEATVSAEKFYFDLGTPIVVAFPKGSTAKNGRIMISMLVEGADTIDILKKNEPMIRNNLLMLIGAQNSSTLNTREGKEMLRKAMLDDTSAILMKMAGKGKVNEIFFTSFIMQ
ncbi:MAG: flagellar basal body-associated FliL family protein [Methylococcales bacterium]|nr:flagellar basal body-associated FliL family protein [Methylobacter sp.]MDP2428419.1 flagellar basal body-associated FliL family protein [Methylobacter sp.]MDP3056644.1 flagellar basal body-associated FliL family protein [Methylobacter sp.]MDP3362187.1 flagellar basal body-associated FliL family protein [Methylobacter sp.]MDZ4157150.1 flagellar basal body-associated FliL family protein [Methylococcales bacterium]